MEECELNILNPRPSTYDDVRQYEVMQPDEDIYVQPDEHTYVAIEDHNVDEVAEDHHSEGEMNRKNNENKYLWKNILLITFGIVMVITIGFLLYEVLKLRSDGDDFKEELYALRRNNENLTRRLKETGAFILKNTYQLKEMKDRLVPRDCLDYLDFGNNISGVYLVYNLRISLVNNLRVLCNQEIDGGGWIVFQRRQDGSVNFKRNWREYKSGFGNLTGDFYLGNDNLHRLTSSKDGEKYELRIDLEDFHGNKIFAKYNNFSVASESDNYKLSVSGYSGTASDSLTYHNGMYFSTFDNDNDRYSSRNCAAKYGGGGWWFNKCYYSNLNGGYGLHKDVGKHKGIGWYHDKNYRNYYFKTTEMKLRRIRSNNEI